MYDFAELRKELRPHGIVAASCPGCVLYDRCGGIEPGLSLFNCFDLRCCNDGTCDNVCPYKQDYTERLLEVGGLEFDNLPPLAQAHAEVPRFVPTIHHRYRRKAALVWPFVALDTYQVLRLKNNFYGSVAADPLGLRQAFGLHVSAQIILRGTAKDPCLERYWAYRRYDNVPEQLAQLGISLVIGPNFSHFLDVPRTDNLFNRKRQLVCLDEMFRAGLSPVPHLNAAQRDDWRFWQDYLRDNDTVRFVAIEFQTGNGHPVEGRKVIDRLTEIQNAIGRHLHLLAIGGAQFVQNLSATALGFSLIDSTPFMKAVKRQLFDTTKDKRPWKKVRTEKGQPIDHLIVHNLTHYAEWIERRCQVVDKTGSKTREVFRQNQADRISLQVCQI